MTVHGGAKPVAPESTAPPWPPDLAEAVAALLAEALVADLRAHPNLATDQAPVVATGVSPGGRAHASPCPRPRRRRSRAAPAYQAPVVTAPPRPG